MSNKKFSLFLIVFIFYIFLLKGFINLLLATIIFAYFTEVFLDVFSSLKEQILRTYEKNVIFFFQNERKKPHFFISLLKKLKITIFMVYVFYFSFFVVFVFFIFIPVSNKVLNVIKNGVTKIPIVFENLKNLFKGIVIKYNLPLDSDFLGTLSNLSRWLDIILNNLMSLLSNILSNLGDWFVLIFVPILALYFIQAKKEFFQWLENNLKGEVILVFKLFDQYQKTYIKAMLVNIFSIMILSSFIFSIFLGLEGVLYGIIYGLFSFIPLIGPFIGSLPVIIIGFGKSVYLGMFFVVLVFLIQQIADNFITPKITQRFLTINPFFSIISILGFYAIFNFWSIFFAIPLSLTLKGIIENIDESKKDNDERS